MSMLIVTTYAPALSSHVTAVLDQVWIPFFMVLIKTLLKKQTCSQEQGTSRINREQMALFTLILDYLQLCLP